MRRLLLLAGLLAGLTGCAGTADPTRFYVLGLVDAPASTPRPAAVGQDLKVGVRAVELPRYLERPQIVTRASANRLELAEFHQWGAPLRLAMPAVLGENLARLLPSEQVQVFPWGRTFTPDAQVLVEITQLEGALNANTVLAARWRILGRSGTEVRAGTSRLSESSGKDYESLVAAHSRLLGALSREIAEALRTEARAAK
jgi:uncharacterized lipoprotein YmbA